MTLDLASEIDVQIKALKIPVGVKRLMIKGQLNVLFYPPSSKPPFFAGVSIFFIEPPELDMDFTGAADFVDLPVLKQVVRNTILEAVRQVAVLPARIAVDLNEEIAATHNGMYIIKIDIYVKLYVCVKKYVNVLC